MPPLAGGKVSSAALMPLGQLHWAVQSRFRAHSPSAAASEGAGLALLQGTGSALPSSAAGERREMRPALQSSLHPMRGGASYAQPVDIHMILVILRGCPDQGQPHVL